MSTKYRVYSAAPAGLFGNEADAGRRVVSFQEYLELKNRYYQVERALFRPASLVDFDLFVLNAQGLTRLADAKQGSVPVTPSMLQVPGDLVIRNEEIPRYRDYLDRLAVEPSLPEKDRPALRVLVLREKSKAIVRDLLVDPRSGERIKSAMGLVHDLVDCLLEKRDVMFDLLSLSAFDYYTYNHSVNVAVLCVGLAVFIGLDRAEVEALGVGAILHDLGKSAVPCEILNKRGRLSAAEFDAIKKHVVEGERIVRAHQSIPGPSHLVVLQHHERLSGRGYPAGLSGAEIGLFGRICAIADSYDAMTTRRPYQAPMTPFAALSRLSGLFSEYDKDLLVAFIRMLGPASERAPEPALPG